MAPWNVINMDQWLRWLTAVMVFFIVFMGSFIAVGAQSASQGPPEDSPAWFHTEPSRPGDKGLYKTALVIVKDGVGEYVDMNARYAFERLPDQRMLDENGEVVSTASFVAEWRTEYYPLDLRDALDIPPSLDLPSLNLPNCIPTPPSGTASDEEWDQYHRELDDCLEAMDAATKEFTAGVQEATATYTAEMAAWVSLLDAPEHIVRASDWHVTHHADNRTLAISYQEGASRIASFSVHMGPLAGPATVHKGLPRPTLTEPLEVPGPCGWQTSLQDGPADMWQAMQVHGECPANMDLGFAEVEHIDGPIEMVVSGKDTVDGRSTVVFSMEGQEDKLRLWFAEDTPYPLRVLTRTTSVPPEIAEHLGAGYRAPSFYVLHELVSFEAGTETTTDEPPKVQNMRLTDAAWGPNALPLAHPWPLVDAVTETAEDLVDCREWGDWLAAHPEAIAHSASYEVMVTPDPDHRDPVTDETWFVRAGDGNAAVLVALHRHTETTVDGPTGAVRVPDVWCSSPTPIPRPDTRGPVPELPGAIARLKALGGSATDYGWTGGALTLERGPFSPDAQKAYESFTIDLEGRLIQWARADTPYPEPTFGDPEWEPRADDDWAIHSTGQGAWVMPPAATAAALTGAAVGAGALVLILPALKGLLGALPMFSRIRKEDLLEHPVRGDLFEAIQADPGIHFQELVRRIGKGRGTTEHHLRKLVAAELLVETTNKGFNCFFPKGEVDRHLMAAAPLLKGEGGRNVLNAICRQPGTVALQVAEHLGMSTSTVNYHIKRLTGAGLVSTERQGRFVVLHGTALGTEALGRFGQT